MKSPLLRSALLALVLGAILPLSARAELVIYDLSFKELPPSVNFPKLFGGFVVLDRTAGSFSSVLILGDPVTGLPYYTSDLLSGTYFQLETERRDLNGVFFGTSGGDSGGDGAVTVDSAAFQAIGSTSKSVGVGNGTNVPIPRFLRGQLLLNGQEAFSTDSFGRRTLDLGFAGASEVRMRLDEGFTRYVNNERFGAGEALNEVIERLKRRGIQPEPTPTPSPSPSPTP